MALVEVAEAGVPTALEKDEDLVADFRRVVDPSTAAPMHEEWILALRCLAAGPPLPQRDSTENNVAIRRLLLGEIRDELRALRENLEGRQG